MLQKFAIETLKLNNLRMEVYVSVIERRKNNRERWQIMFSILFGSHLL